MVLQELADLVDGLVYQVSAGGQELVVPLVLAVGPVLVVPAVFQDLVGGQARLVYQVSQVGLALAALVEFPDLVAIQVSAASVVLMEPQVRVVSVDGQVHPALVDLAEMMGPLVQVVLVDGQV